MNIFLAIPRFLASRIFTIVLLACAVVFMAFITVVEAIANTGEVPYPLYLSWWFVTLLWLVFINLLCNVAHRRWWHVRKLPAILAHVGFLLILLGGLFTWKLGIRGNLPIAENDAESTFVAQSPVVRISRNDTGSPELLFLSSDGIFRSRNFVQAVMPFGESRSATLTDGERLEILDVMPHSQTIRVLNEDPQGASPPGIIVSVTEGHAKPVQVWLHSGESTPLSGTSFSQVYYAHRGPDETAHGVVSEVFQEWITISPPGKDPITMHVALPADVGKEFSQGGFSVKILEYHPNFKVGRKPSPQDLPHNPAVKLHVKGPAAEKDVFAFSRFAFHGNTLADGTTVNYRRPGGATLLVVSRAEGACEVYTGSGTAPLGLSRQAPLVLGTGHGTFSMTLTAFARSGRFSTKIIPSQDEKAPPAFLVAVGDGGVPAWVSHEGGTARSQDAELSVTISTRYPLGFSLTLDNAVAEHWPASMIPKAYYSEVRIRQGDHGSETQHRIETNAPLTIQGFTLYQSNMDQKPPYQWSGFSVSYDPGLPLVSSGFFAMTIGLLWLYVVRFIVHPLRRRRAQA